MRLQLRRAVALGAALSVATCGGARAEPVVSADLRSSIYDDSDATFINTSTLALRGYPTENITLKARALVDVISTASVDVVSAATDRWDEVRREFEGGAGFRDGTRTLNATYIHSQENDWLSHTFVLAGSHDFASHTMTLGLGAALVLNEVGRADDANFAEDLTVVTGTFDATWVATRTDLLSATYTFGYLTGYQASPYRFARIEDPNAPGLVYGAPEHHPDTRVRHAVGLRWLRHVFQDSAIRSHLRLYGDSWALLSVTGGAEYVIGLDDFEIGLIARGYLQRRAGFYEDVYPEPRRYMTADRELSTFFDGFGGGRLGFRRVFGGALEELRADVKVEGFAFRFTEFARLPSRTGLLAELGIGASF